MDLRDLGYDSWFQQHKETYEDPLMRPARVSGVDRDRYTVLSETGEITAELTGRLRFAAETSEDIPCVGDWVVVHTHNEETLAIIHGVLPRKTLLRRKTPGKEMEFQLIAANIDVACIVQSCEFDFNIRRLERYLVAAKDGNIEPLIVLTKTDLVTPEEVTALVGEIRDSGIAETVCPLSATAGQGLEEFRTRLVRGKTFCLLGSSGVGKTTLLNHLLGAEVFETASVREKDGKGRHATARRQLIALDNGALLIDTPGMRELALMGAESGIDESFPEISELTGQCRFADCTHTQEVGCAVLAALEDGRLSQERYESYRKLVKESAYHEMSHLERRKRDKKFGRLVKSVLKHHKKR